jgi:hypothetical protein
MKLLLVSSVVPEPTQGGQLALRNLFLNSPHINFLCATYVRIPDLPSAIIKPTLLRRLTSLLIKQSFLKKHVNSLYAFLPCLSHRLQLERLVRSFQPDIIVTVAHGYLWKDALHISTKLRIPLAVFLHDWWPDFLHVPKLIRDYHERKYLDLLSRAALVFTISPLANNYFRSHAKPVLLYPTGFIDPIDTSVRSSALNRHLSRIVVKYAGNLDEYPNELSALAALVSNLPNINLQIAGRSVTWPRKLKLDLHKRHILYDFIPNEHFNSWLNEADIVLVIMSFQQCKHRHTQVSFPSKIVKYSCLGIPTLVWAPAYSSAVHWARESQGALIVSEPSAQAVIDLIHTIDVHRLQQLAVNASLYASKHFSSQAVIKIFSKSLHQIARS